VAAPVAAAFGWRWGVAAVVVLSALAATAFILLAPPQRGFRRT
jgi:MFS transporter, YNFM family, putative membrane transport protein